jgi:hypothetical protein
MLRRTRRRRGESGQVLIMALAFIAFFGVVIAAVLSYADSIDLQETHAAAAVATNAPVEGSALFAAVNAAYSSTGCTPNVSASLTMEGGAGVRYTTRNCDPSTSTTQDLGAECDLCLLNQPGQALSVDGGTLSVDGPVAIDGGVAFGNTGMLASNGGSPRFIGCLQWSGRDGCASSASHFSPAPTKISQVADPLGTVTFPGIPPSRGPACVQVSLGGNQTETLDSSQPLCSVSVSGTATLKLSGGVYTIIGPFTVQDDATVTSSAGVLLYFTCADFSGDHPWPCQSWNQPGGDLDLSGNASVSLSPIASGPGEEPDDMVVYVDRNETQGSSCDSGAVLCVRDNATAALKGSVYAASGGIDVEDSAAVTIGSAAYPGEVVASWLTDGASGKGSGLSLPEGLAPASGFCSVYDDSLGTASTAGQYALVASAGCGDGAGLIDVNYAP